MQLNAEFTDDGIRLKNTWTGKYLMVIDTGDYAEIIVKDLRNDWASQVWDFIE